MSDVTVSVGKMRYSAIKPDCVICVRLEFELPEKLPDVPRISITGTPGVVGTESVPVYQAGIHTAPPGACCAALIAAAMLLCGSVGVITPSSLSCIMFLSTYK